MALKQKETPEVAPTGGMVQKRYTGMDFSPLGQGIQNFGRGMMAVSEIRDRQEDVSALIEEGQWEMQRREADYQHLKGTQAADPQEFIKFQESMFEVMTHRMEGAKTKQGRLQVRNALNHIRGVIESRSYNWHKNKVDAQATDSANAQLKFYASSASNTIDTQELNKAMAGAEDLAWREAQRMSMDPVQSELLMKNMMSSVIAASMNGAVERGDYNAAKEQEQFFLKYYPDLMGTQEESEGTTKYRKDPFGNEYGSSSLGKQIHAQVDSLRVKQTAYDYVTGYLGKQQGFELRNAFNFAEDIMLNRENVRPLIARAEKDGVSREQLYSAAVAMREERIRMNKERADMIRSEYEPIWTVQADKNALDWESGFFDAIDPNGQKKTYSSPAEYHAELLKLASTGDEAAAEQAIIMWKRWHPKETLGDGRSVAQWAEGLKYLITLKQRGGAFGNAEINFMKQQVSAGVFPPEILDPKVVMPIFNSLLTEERKETHPTPEVAKDQIESYLRGTIGLQWTDKQLEFVFGESQKDKDGITDTINRKGLKQLINEIVQRVSARGGQMSTTAILLAANEAVTRKMTAAISEENNKWLTQARRSLGLGGYQEHIKIAPEMDPEGFERLQWASGKNPETYFVYDYQRKQWRLKDDGELYREAVSRGWQNTNEYKAAKEFRARLNNTAVTYDQYTKELEKYYGAEAAQRAAFMAGQPKNTTSTVDYTTAFKKVPVQRTSKGKNANQYSVKSSQNSATGNKAYYTGSR